jgi:hypothetical protein
VTILDDVGHFLFGEFGGQFLHGLAIGTFFLAYFEDAKDQ